MAYKGFPTLPLLPPFCTISPPRSIQPFLVGKTLPHQTKTHPRTEQTPPPSLSRISKTTLTIHIVNITGSNILPFTMDGPGPTSSSSSPPSSSSGMPCPTPPSPATCSTRSPTNSATLDLGTLFDTLNHLARAHAQLLRLQGWLEAYAKHPDMTCRPIERLLRVVSRLDDNFVLVITSLQSLAVNHGSMPVGCLPSALRRTAQYSAGQITLVLDFLAEAVDEDVDVTKVCENAKRDLKDLVEIFIDASRNVDFYVCN